MKSDYGWLSKDAEKKEEKERAQVGMLIGIGKEVSVDFKIKKNSAVLENIEIYNENCAIIFDI